MKYVKTKYPYVFKYDDGDCTYKLPKGSVCEAFDNYYDNRYEMIIYPIKCKDWLADISFSINCGWEFVEPATKDDLLAELI